MANKTRTGYVIGGLVLLALIFQFFFRFQYQQLADGDIMRIDRVNGSSCNMPCTPTPATPVPTAAPTPTPFDYVTAGENYVRKSDEQDQEAILLVKGTSLAQQLVNTEGPQYSWSAKTTDSMGQTALATIAKYGNAWETPNPKNTNPVDKILLATPPPLSSPSFQTKLVCYCDSKGTGWRWEVHTDTSAIYFVNDNADLTKKYGFK